MPETLYCVNHPDRETLLRCGKCGQPICPECAVRHPVGLRCPQCARMKKVPTYDVPASYYLRALGAGLGTALVCAVVAQVLPYFVPLTFYSLLSLLTTIAIGAIVSEAISRVTHYKRGRGLQIVAALSVLLGYIGGTMIITAYPFDIIAWLHLVANIVLSPYYWAYPIIAAAVAVIRLR
jgi:hypothetical protein